MRVLITTEFYLPFSCGVTSAIEAEKKALEKRGDEVRVLTIGKNKKSYYDEKLKVWYIAHTLPQFYKDSYASLNVHDKILRSVITWRPDIVHSQTEFFSFCFARYIASTLNLPLVHTCHTDFVSYAIHFTSFTRPWNYFSSRLIPLFIKRADRVICSTDKIASLISSYKIKQPIDRVFVGVDLELFKRELEKKERESMRINFGLSSQDFLFLTISRLSSEKNIAEAISLFSYLKKRKNNVKYLIVGEGEEREKLERLSKEYFLSDSIIFLGEKKREELYRYYQLADFYIGSSLSETQCLSYVEAMASGLPILVKYDSVLDNYLISGFNGFSYKSKKEFLSIAEKLIESKELREKISLEAEKSADEFSLTLFGERLSSVFSKAREGRYEK